MRDPWTYVEILKYFPQVIKNEKLFVQIEGDFLSRDAIIHKWSAYCNGPRNNNIKHQAKKDRKKGDKTNKKLFVLGRRKKR